MLPPVIERELRAALRKGNAQQGWVLAAWLVALLTLIFLLGMLAQPERAGGRVLFSVLFSLGIATTVVRSMRVTADLFSEERRSGTLGLLFLTGLSTREIFASKLLGATLISAYLLLGGMPFFAVPFLAGGVPLTDFVCAVTFLANWLLFCVAVGVLASVLNREASQAQLTAAFILGALCLGTPACYGATELFSSVPLSEEWLLVSPLYGPFMVLRGFATGSPQAFWFNSAITLAYSLLCLLLAGEILHRSWQDRPEGWLHQKWTRWSARLRARVGCSEALRRQLLAKNPFIWLAARDQSLVFTARLFLSLVGVIWCVGFAAWPHGWLSTVNFFVTALVLHLGLMWIMLHAAAKRFGEERSSGGIELLLVTPLSVEALVSGQRKALLLQFRPLLLLLGGIDLFCMVGGLTLQTGTVMAAVNYVMAWLILPILSVTAVVALTGRVMWISLWTGRPAYAVLQTVVPNLWLLAYGAFAIGHTIVLEFPKGTDFELALLTLLLLLAVIAAVWTKPLDLKLKREFRLIAAEPIPDVTEPRFRRWRAEWVIPQGWKPTRVRPPARTASGQSSVAETVPATPAAPHRSTLPPD